MGNATYEEKWALFQAPGQPTPPSHMRLNQAGASGGGSGPGGQARLNVTSSLLDTRAGKADEVRGSFLKADDDVMRETGEVPGTLTGFAADEALTAFQERWRDQMSYVQEKFTGTVQALRDAAEAFRLEEEKRRQSFGGGKQNSNGQGGGTP
ncbi:hypothetical protein [Streptomyces sp. SAJ15]|uniref:hypothetical protein n=1 Tax=Streptomyces sp. SAJ15 TaxID=2011095 RepID=UPI0011863762|nr:hypothetical protein [Streptomyces sp. SAJ15]TVL91782.1 hypothetical protein CD790_13840 [Streptomyces sp. SAJ15]